ncbi:MAG: hypothetical protein WDW38_006154 [Sanguina aurantia]
MAVEEETYERVGSKYVSVGSDAVVAWARQLGGRPASPRAVAAVVESEGERLPAPTVGARRAFHKLRMVVMPAVARFLPKLEEGVM